MKVGIGCSARKSQVALEPQSVGGRESVGASGLKDLQLCVETRFFHVDNTTLPLDGPASDWWRSTCK